MPDLEKVIKGLECAVVGITSDEECSKCAYQPYRFGRCKWDVMADALELLKEQEPLKPVLKQFKLGFHTDAVCIEPCCGGCGRKLETWYKYCSYCTVTTCVVAPMKVAIDPDLVKVVRCRDCVEWEAPTKAEQADGETFGHCRCRFGTCYGQKVDMNWFCADGERGE